MAQTYMHAIPSIQAKNLTLPAMLGELSLNVGIAEGKAIARQDLRDAKAVATALRVKSEGGDPLVTENIVESAELREKAIEYAHCMADYAPMGLVEALRDIRSEMRRTNLRLDEILEDNACSRAKAENLKITARNMRLLEEPCLPLQKTIPGHGIDLSTELGRHLGIIVDDPLIQIARVGEVPPSFNGAITSYDDAEILRMVSFYNNDFGISPADTLATRIDKFKIFLLLP